MGCCLSNEPLLLPIRCKKARVVAVVAQFELCMPTERNQCHPAADDGTKTRRAGVESSGNADIVQQLTANLHRILPILYAEISASGTKKSDAFDIC
ncbi:hypothetical protein niasHS_009314 [Heterodera schachtii]|uniref:Uncharacterized protein n=1 Tax=Heterodera schachtii TaxID=97005 RepID=A0ABD2JC33_HETSC